MPSVERRVEPCNSFLLPVWGRETVDVRRGVRTILKFSPEQVSSSAFLVAGAEALDLWDLELPMLGLLLPSVFPTGWARVF